MAWYSSNYKYRAAVTIDASASAGGAADVIVLIPDAWDEFWTTIQSTGYDVVFFSDVSGVITHERETWVYASRSARFNLDDFTAIADSVQVVWLYWGYSAAPDLSSSFVETDDLYGLIELTDPTKAAALVVCAPQQPGATTPLAHFAKTANADIGVWWDVTPLLLQAATPLYGTLLLDELSRVDFGGTGASGDTDAYDSTGTKASLILETNTRVRFLEDRTYVFTQFEGGTTGSDYSLRLRAVIIRRMSTTGGAPYIRDIDIDARALLSVQDLGTS